MPAVDGGWAARFLGFFVASTVNLVPPTCHYPGKLRRDLRKPLGRKGANVRGWIWIVYVKGLNPPASNAYPLGRCKQGGVQP
jgi:hypothetical protein